MFNIKLKIRVSHPPFLRKMCVLCQSESVVKKRGRLRNSWTLKHSKSENIWTELSAVEGRRYRHVQVMLPSSPNQNSPWISPFSQSASILLVSTVFFFLILKWESIPFAKASTTWSDSRLRYFRMSETLVSDSIRFYRLLLQQSSWVWCFCRPLTSLGEMKHNNITNFSSSFHLVFHDFSFTSFRLSSHWISNFRDLTFV